VSSRRATLPSASQAHAQGAGPWRLMAKSNRRVVTSSQLKASTRPISRFKPGIDQIYEQPGQLFGGRNKVCLVGRIEDCRTKGKRTPVHQSHQVGGRHESDDHIPRIRHDQVLHILMKHVECGIYGKTIRSDSQEASAHDCGNWRFWQNAARHNLLSKVGVAHDP
jgi:hypothetical protein